jgi:hypothetical protein
MSVRRRALAVPITLLFFTCLSFAGVVRAQGKGAPQLRTVHGQVFDNSENPVQGSVVFLRNTRNNMVRSQISDESGNYRFSGLDPNVDYELHAEKDGNKSNTRTVSSFDSRKEIVLNLKMERKKA